MVKSMTGFGQAHGGNRAIRWNVEIRSWNHRFFEFSARLPNALADLEERIRDLVHSRMRRGKMTLSVSTKDSRWAMDRLMIDEQKVEFYIRAIRNIQKKYRLKDPIGINALLGIPNLFMAERDPKEVSEYWPSLKRVVEQALARLERVKVREGQALARDIKKRTDLIDRAVDTIESVSKGLPAERRHQLTQRVHQLAKGISLDSERLEREVALMAERSDITEELVRIRHHLNMIRSCLAGSDEAGKKFDFITQEIHREANTIASKAQHARIAEEVIRVKGELERIREQVQNIE